MKKRRRCGRPRERGSALVEVALIVSFFALPLLIGGSEVGTLAYESMEVSDAAYVGASYGMTSTVNAANAAGIILAAQTEASDFGINLVVVPTTYFVCSQAMTGTQYAGVNAQSNATAECTGTGNHALELVQVQTSATVTPKIHLPSMPSSFTFNGLSVMEVEQ